MVVSSFFTSVQAGRDMHEHCALCKPRDCEMRHACFVVLLAGPALLVLAVQFWDALYRICCSLPASQCSL